MKEFRTRTYEIFSPKIREKEGVRFALLADLHGLEFGPDNCRLEAAIRMSNPNVILVAGDMIVRIEKRTLPAAKRFLLTLARDYPIYYALGNHEAKMIREGTYLREYEAYEKSLRDGGVIFLRNERAVRTIGQDRYVFHGLELPLKYYHKPNSPALSIRAMEQLIGKKDPSAVNILLAHNPKYGNTYFSWGADLTVSGHYHGGILRLSEHHGLTCPQFLLFPPYCCGDFHKGNCHMIVSAGLGEHTIPIRIHNPRELLLIHMKPARDGK